jgi:CopG family nickel-responsive transcriptional regulator
MDRFTVSLEAELLAQFDEHIRQRGYGNRSEAVRDILRHVLEAKRLAEEGGSCIACLSYVYNHHERELPRRLVQASHDHHDLTLSTLHVHLDHETCMEASILRGPTALVRRFADAVIAETGVRHGRLHAVPVETEAPDAHSHPHPHRHPKT